MRRPSTTSPSRGFTLTELLIVMGVLAVLTWLAIPTIKQIAQVSRRTVCMSNLSAIGKAYYTCKADEANRGMRTGSFNPFQAQISAQAIGSEAPQHSDILRADNWGSVLRPHLGGTRALECPSFAPGSEFGVMPDIRLRVYGDGGAEKSDYEIYITSAFPYWDYGAAKYCQSQPGIWRRNSAPEAADFPEWQSAVNKMEKYEPGANPNISWYMLETARYGDDYYAGGDLDWNDLVIKVTETHNSVIIEPYQLYGWAGQVYNLVDPDSGLVYGSETESVGRDGNLGPFEFAKTTVSYGMNSQEAIIVPGLDRILALDYGNRVCYTGPTQRDDVPYDALKAPRHLGKCNALYADGAVISHDPDAINPEASEEIYTTLWAPLGDD
jgi:prepilin-type N-terminal cleavage/methylation domain-containing protein/prepilin-type processing-associated H-X9-DG protein